MIIDLTKEPTVVIAIMAFGRRETLHIYGPIRPDGVADVERQFGKMVVGEIERMQAASKGAG